MSDKTEEPDEDHAVVQENTLQENSLEETPIDPIEGSSSSVNPSPPQETSNDTPTASVTQIAKPGDSVKCETCQTTSTHTFFKRRASAAAGKAEDIFRNYCTGCKDFFGLCSKKVRGVFIFVTEEGRILTNAEKMEYLRGEKRKRSVSRKENEVEIDANPTNSDTSTNGISEENQEQEEEGLKLGTLPGAKTVKKEINSGLKRRKKGKSRFSSIKNKKRKVEAALAAGPSSVPTPRKPPATTSTPALPKRRESERHKPTTPSPSCAAKVPRKPGRPVGSCRVIQQQQQQQSRVIQTPIKAPEQSNVETTESEVQTDQDLLLKSVCLDETFNKTLEAGLDEQVNARLKDQPLVVRKQFVMMMRTIEEQEVVIKKFSDVQEKYQTAVRKLKEFGRQTRLTYSDNFRLIRADMVERKEEFKAHESEVVSIIKKQKDKYDAFKKELMKKYDEFQLEKEHLEAKIAFLEQEKVYERNRAEFFLRKKDVYELQTNEANETAKTAVKNLNDRLFVAENEKCAHCRISEKLRKQLTAEVAEMTTTSKAAVAQRDEMIEKAGLYEAAAQKLGKDCDTVKYERDSWQAYAVRYQKEVTRLTKVVKEKEKELAERGSEALTTPKSTPTPISIACTPNDAERVSPPDGPEVTSTPDSAISTSSAAKPHSKSFAKKLAEKKASLPIASGFESWIPKDKLNAPAPEIPKARSAFGAPIKTPQQREAEKTRLAPSQQPTPWEKSAIASSTPASDSLAMALNQVQADSFFNGSNSSNTNTNSRTYTEEISKLMRKRGVTTETVKEEKDKKPSTPSITSPVPPQKKSKPIPSTPAVKSTPGPSVSSSGPLSNMMKIPKLSDKPPVPEFAAALGLNKEDEEESGSIPGLGGLDDSLKEEVTKKRPEVKKPTPPVPVKTENIVKQNPPTQQNHKNAQKKKKALLPYHRQDQYAEPWDRPSNLSPWGRPQQTPPPRQNQYGIQSNARFDSDRSWNDGPSSSSFSGISQNRDSFGAPLPWHRSQDTPFGKVPIRDQFSVGQASMMPRGGPPPMGMGGPPGPPRPPMSFYNTTPNDSRDFYRHSNNGYSPPNSMGRGNPRSFYG
uniref:Uncharacterized protein n=1 Tax=Caenorhabditis japonica TaxID=281687 RepID=A0A8R1HXV3_CAEJA